MDTVEQAAAPVEQPAAPVEVAAENSVEAPTAPQDQAVVTPAAPQDPPPVTAEAVTKEAGTHKVCKNCGYHDPSGKDMPRCPACNFRHASQPVHQAPVKQEAPPKKATDPQAAPAEDAAKADDKPAEEPSTQGETAGDAPAGGKPNEAEPAEDVVDGQAVRVVEKIVIVEKVPTEPARNAVQDAGKAVEEQG